MTTNNYQIKVGKLIVDVVRKDIKNLHLAVYPPLGRIRVAVPLCVKDESVRLAVISRLPWINKQKSKLINQARESKREYVTGESHYFQGRRYRLNIVLHDGKSYVAIRNKCIMDMYVNKINDRAHREKIMLKWYRQQLEEKITTLLAYWQKLIGVSPAKWRLRKMKTKWGTCNIKYNRICFNPELAKKSTQCLEYVIVHELIHLLERHHNERFIKLMDKYMPQWRIHRDELNCSPLKDEVWRT